MKALLHPIIFYRYYCFHKRGRSTRTAISMAINSIKRVL